MIRPLRRLLIAGVTVTVIGVIAAVGSISDYLAHPQALNSMSGLVVFRREYELLDDPRYSLVQYLPFEWGAQPLVIGIGIVLVVASVALSAGLWSGPRPSGARARRR